MQLVDSCLSSNYTRAYSKCIECGSSGYKRTMTENIHQSTKQAKHQTRTRQTYRVGVGIPGFCCLPIVGIPLFRP